MDGWEAPHFRSTPWQTKAPCSSGPVQGSLRGASPQTRTGGLSIFFSKVTQLTSGHHLLLLVAVSTQVSPPDQLLLPPPRRRLSNYCVRTAL